MTKKALKHIDNNFFKLTASQAKYFSIDGELPRYGWEKKADMEKLKGVELVHGREYSNRVFDASNAEHGWIKRTRLSWFDGAPVKDGFTWAIHIHFPLT